MSGRGNKSKVKKIFLKENGKLGDTTEDHLMMEKCLNLIQ